MKPLFLLTIVACCVGCAEKKDHRTLTSIELSEMSDRDLEFEVYEQLLITIEEGGFKDLESAFSLLTPGQRALCVTMNLDGEVANGGFNQYYYNTDPRQVEIAEGSFRLIGAHKYADIVKEANDVYNNVKDSLDAKNDGTLESFSESYKNNPLNALDDKWYALSALEPLGTITVKYIRDHEQEFAKD